MQYNEFERWLREAIERASPERRLIFAQETVRRMLREDLLDSVLDPGNELNEKAWEAFNAARDGVFALSPEDIATHIQTVDQGTLTDGDMDTGLLFMLEALDAWSAFRARGAVDDLFALAITSVNDVDFEVGTDIKDFLATPENAGRERAHRKSLGRGWVRRSAFRIIPAAAR